MLGNSCDINSQISLDCEENPADQNENKKTEVRFVQRSSIISLETRSWLTVVILTCVNLLNYMDRFSIAGVLLKVKSYYSISDTEAGLLTTVFIISYMLLSPVFGYMGDRWNRKFIMSCGIAFWSIITLASSFVGAQGFYSFLFLRALVGIGEASYSTIAPTLIADFFSDNTRTRALSLFYFAIPVGSGLGYIIGSEAAELLGGWQWALRITPAFGLFCSLMVCLFVHEPPRGAADQSSYLETTSWFQDIKYLFKHKSFMLTSCGFTCVAFVTGALALWAPVYVYFSILVQPNLANDANVSMIFGAITCLAGILGVVLGSSTASWLRKKTPKADPYICAFGLISSAPFLFLSLFFSRFNTPITYIFIFIAEICLFLNWALVSDMILYLVLPTRRSTAGAVQILMSHALGDAWSPTLIGSISEGIQKSFNRSDVVVRYQSLQFSLYLTCFVSVIGGAFFLAASLFIDEDRMDTKRIMKGYESISESDGEDPA